MQQLFLEKKRERKKQLQEHGHKSSNQEKKQLK
jgi:hypothetical protein